MLPRIRPGGNNDETPETETPTSTPATTPTDPSTTEQEGTTVWGERDITLDANEPAAVVRTFYEALYAGDAETVNELLHKDSPTSGYSQEALSNLKHYDYQLKNLHRVEAKSDGGSVTLSFTLVLTGSEGDTQRREETVEVRRSGENWRVWK